MQKGGHVTQKKLKNTGQNFPGGVTPQVTNTKKVTSKVKK
jgi:hypothetical protein